MNFDTLRTTGQGEGLESDYIYTSLILSSLVFSWRATTEIGILPPSCYVDITMSFPQS